MTLWPRSLLWQLCLALIGIQVLVAAGYGWYVTRHVGEFHRQQSLQELERLMPILVSRYEMLMAVGEDARDELQRVVTSDGQAERGLRITVIDDRGVVLADSMEHPDALENHRDRPEVAAALATGTGTSVRYSTSVSRDMIYLAQRSSTAQPAAASQPVDRPSSRDEGRGDLRSPFIVRAALALDIINAPLAATLRILALGGLGTLTLTALLFYLVSRRLSRSIAALAEDVAGADPADAAARKRHVSEPPVRELAPIIAAFSDLSAKLHDRIEELSRRHREHEAILQSMSSGVVALDREQRVISINHAAARLFNLDPDAVRHRLLQEVIRHPAVHRHVRQSLTETADSIVPIEFHIRSEEPIIVELTSSRLSDAAGRTTGLLLVFNNITELRRLESIRSDFAANVSHELRTPITNIKGYVETMLEVGTSDQEQVGRFLDIIKRNADRLAAIIEDILSLAWLEQPGTRESLAREPIPVAELIDSVISDFRNAAEAKDIGLHADAPSDLEITANRPLIEQALVNYVSNAIKYSPIGTNVTISAAPGNNSEVVFSVTDQGPGIGRDHLSRIFERFYRVDKARSRELGGTGLGLAIVKHIALVHRGRVQAESKVGKGSTFKLVLPKGE